MGQFQESDITGGAGPNGEAADGPSSTQLGFTYWFVGLAANGHSIWAPRYADHHTLHIPSEPTISAALALVGGARYLQVGTTDTADNGCGVFEAGAPNAPAPGPGYVRVGTSGAAGIPDYFLGAGLPLYARPTATSSLVNFVLRLTGGTP